MKIGINGMATRIGGGITYLKNITLNILNISDCKIHLFVSSAARDRLNLPGETARLTVESIDVSGIVKRLYFEQSVIPQRIRQENIDVLYSPCEIPVLCCPCKQVVANQNANLYNENTTYESINTSMKHVVLAKSLELSQKLSEATIFVTETSRRKATNKLNISMEDTFSIHHGVDSSYRRNLKNGGEIGLGEQRYILLVSNLYRHKNVDNLILAYSHLSAKIRNNHPLVIVGDKTIDEEYTQQIEELISNSGVADNVSLVGHVSESSIKSYYSNAHLFVFPSLIESFGLPILEAMAAGVPVVASANAAIPEVGSDAALYFDPKDPDQMSVIIEQALKDQSLRESLVKRGRIRARDFSWERCARETLEVFEKVLRS